MNNCQPLEEYAHLFIAMAGMVVMLMGFMFLDTMDSVLMSVEAPVVDMRGGPGDRVDNVRRPMGGGQ